MTTDPPEDTQALLAQAESNGAVDLVSAALVECQGQLKAAEFDATNPFFKSKYATLGSVIAASREPLAKNGLAILQIPTIHGSLVSVHTRIVHKSGQSLDCGTMGLALEGNDRNSDAQIAGSIITYLRRYSWASILGIYADLDDDGNTGPKGAIPRKMPLNASGAPSPPPDTTQGNKTLPEGTGSTLKPLGGDEQRKLDDWMKYRLKVLNKLEAAPGQPNRKLLTDFLTDGGVLTMEQVLEDWPFKTIPTDAKGIADLKAKMEAYRTQREEVPQ